MTDVLYIKVREENRVLSKSCHIAIVFMNGKEMHRQARFIDMQRFEHQLKLMYDSCFET